MGGTGLATGALNDREFGHGQTAAIGSTSVRAGAFIKDSSLYQAEATKRPWRDPIELARRSPFASKVFSSFYFLQTVLSSNAEHGV